MDVFTLLEYLIIGGTFIAIVYFVTRNGNGDDKIKDSDESIDKNRPPMEETYQSGNIKRIRKYYVPSSPPYPIQGYPGFPIYPMSASGGVTVNVNSGNPPVNPAATATGTGTPGGTPAILVPPTLSQAGPGAPVILTVPTAGIWWVVDYVIGPVGTPYTGPAHICYGGEVIPLTATAGQLVRARVSTGYGQPWSTEATLTAA